MNKIRVLDLFSGIGGISLGLERTGGFETVAFCEIEEFPRKVLAKHWPNVPCFNDIRELKGEDIGPVDVICGGYPCQPFSTAGKRGGAQDDRHLWPEFSRLVAELRPTWVIGENVAGHISMGLDDVLSDLEGQGYACRTFVIPAVAVDAPHRRDRVWTVANANDAGLQGRQEAGNIEGQRTRRNEQPERRADLPRAAWPTEPAVGRVANGVSVELDIIGGLVDEKGNYPKAEPAARRFVWKILREMWSQQELAATSPELYIQRLCDIVPEVPHRSSHGGWLLGKRIKEDKGLRDLWEAFYAKSFKEAQDMQQELLERIGKKKRPQEMGTRADRLKALGNAVVPQIPEIIGHAILEAIKLKKEISK